MVAVKEVVGLYHEAKAAALVESRHFFIFFLRADSVFKSRLLLLKHF